MERCLQTLGAERRGRPADEVAAQLVAIGPDLLWSTMGSLAKALTLHIGALALYGFLRCEERLC